jgi:hypothetical protein
MSKLRQLAPLLDQLPLVSDAPCAYDWLSGALLWTDEVPDLARVEPGTFEALRGVLHYRTCLVLGESSGQDEDLWLLAQSLFPNWPGFQPGRRSVELRALCQRLKEAAVREMDRIFGAP